MRYDKIEEFNVDSKAEFDQLNLAHETKKKQESRAAARKPSDAAVLFGFNCHMLFHFLSSSYKKVPRPFFRPPP